MTKHTVGLLLAVPILASISEINAQQPNQIDAALFDQQPRNVRVDEDAAIRLPDVVVERQLQPTTSPPVSQTPQHSEYCDDCPAKHSRLQRVKSHLQYSHWGYAEQFYPRPFGTFVRSAVDAQVSNGLAAQLTLYRYDFVDPSGRVSTTLNPHGRIRLVRMAGILSSCPYPLNIEYDQDHPQVNEGRRQHVLAQLQQMIGSVANEQVIVRIPAVRGRDADEGLLLYQSLLRQVEQGDAPKTSGSIQGRFLGAGAGSGTGSSSAGATPTR